MKIKWFSLFTAFLVCAMADLTFATTWIVDDDGSFYDFRDIQDAVDVATDGDQILVMPGTYIEYARPVINFTGKKIQIIGSSMTDTILKQQGPFPVVVAVNGESGAVLDGFTITGGQDSGVQLVSSILINDCLIQDNYGTYAGGVLAYGFGSSELRDCIIQFNTKYGSNSGAGGVHVSDCNPKISRCVISGNLSSTATGGVYVQDECHPEIVDSIIENNQGHGIMAEFACVDVNNCNVTQNTGSGIHLELLESPFGIGPQISDSLVALNEERGIAVHGSDVEATISDCLVQENEEGGVSFIDSRGTLIDSEIANNIGGLRGAGILALSDDPSHVVSVSGCEIYGNYCVGDSSPVVSSGGAVYCNSVLPGLLDCMVSGNQAALAGGIMCEEFSDFSLVDCLVQNNINEGSSSHVSILCQGDLSVEGTVFKANESLISGICDLNAGFRTRVLIEGENDLGELTEGFQATLVFQPDSHCQMQDALTSVPAAFINYQFDINQPDSDFMLEMDGLLDADGCLSIINSSGTLQSAQLADQFPLIRADFQGESFSSVVFPVMPDGLGLRLTDQLNTSGRASTDLGVEVVEVDTPEFNTPFTELLSSPPVDLISLDVDGDGDDELAALFDGAPGSVAVYDITEDASPSLMAGFSIFVGDGPLNLDSADLDDDGDDDLIVTNTGDSTITILLSDAIAGFSATTLSIASGSPTCAAIIDWDGSADLDAVIGIDSPAGSPDEFQIVRDIATGAITGPSYAIPLVDGESDPPRCVSGGPAQDAWGFAAGTQAGQVLHADSSSVSLDQLLTAGGNGITAIRARDLDKAGGDTLIDIVASSDERECLYLFQGLSGGFGPPIQIDVLVPVVDFVILDPDDDDDLDFILASPGSGSEPLLLLRNDEPSLPLRALAGRRWSKQTVQTNNSPRSMASGTLDPKDEEDDWVVGSAAVAALRGGMVGEMEQTLLGPPVCPEDVDGNSVVDIEDLLLLLANFGQSGDGDIDGSGLVTIDDLLMLLSSFGAEC